MRGFRAWATDPRHRRFLIVGVAAAVVFAVVLRRRAAAAPPAATDTAAVGPLFDPTATDPAALTDGVPNALGDGGTTGGPAVSNDPPAWYTDPPPWWSDAPPANGGAGDGSTTTGGGGDGDTKPPATTAGFWWNIGGKQTYVTRKNAPAFVASLRAHGVNPDAWAAKHPDAARSIGITPPAKPPPQRPGHSSPAGETGGAARSKKTSAVAGHHNADPGLDVPTVVASVVNRTAASRAAATQRRVSHTVLTHVRPAPPKRRVVHGGRR